MLSIHRIFVTGVECDSITGSTTYGRVQSMYLSSSSLTGTLPSSIGNFGSLTIMIIVDTRISGTIPSTISGLRSVQGLSLYSNSLVGTIPSTISALISVQYLYLDRNLLSGTIPSTMSALTSLKSLSLSNNYLTMGTATSVPISTFSSTTLSGSIGLAENCLVFYTIPPYPYIHVTATHCRSTGKYEVCCPNILYFDVIVYYILFMLLSITVITLHCLPYCLSNNFLLSCWWFLTCR